MTHTKLYEASNTVLSISREVEEEPVFRAFKTINGEVVELSPQKKEHTFHVIDFDVPIIKDTK